MANKESGSLLLLAGSIPLFTQERAENLKLEKYVEEINGTEKAKCGGVDYIESELTVGFGCEATDAAKLLLACHNNGVLARGPQQGMYNNDDHNNTCGNCHKSMEKDEKEKVVVEEESGEIKREEKNNGDGSGDGDSMSRMTTANGHVPPKLEHPQGGGGGGGSHSPQPMLDSLVDLATKELMHIVSENEDLSTNTNNNDMENSSSVAANECGTVLISLKNDVWEKKNGFAIEDDKSKGSNRSGMVTRQSRINWRPRSVSDPEGVNEWGYHQIVKGFDAIKEESYEVCVCPMS